MAGVRGAGDGPMIAQSSVATIILETQKADGQNVRLTGQIADEVGDQERWDGALVELRREDKLLASTFVDDLGGFTCPLVAGGRADLRITGANGTLIIVGGVEL